MANGTVDIQARMWGSGHPFSASTLDAMGEWTSVMGEVLTTAYSNSQVELNTKHAYALSLYIDYTNGDENNSDVLFEVSDDSGTTWREIYDGNYKGKTADYQQRKFIKLNRFEDMVRISAKSDV
jgi:hypothetical protein